MQCDLSIGFGYACQCLLVIETNQQFAGEHVFIGLDQNVSDLSRHRRRDFDLTRSRLDASKRHRFPEILNRRTGGSRMRSISAKFLREY